MLCLLSLITAGMLSGCGAGAHTSMVSESSPLHGGILIPLPENQGFVELLNDKHVMKGRVLHTTIVAYFLQPDRKSPITQPAPAITIKLGAPPDVRTVTMRPEPDGKDPSGSARFVSDIGPYLLNQSGGEIQAGLGSKSFTVPFRGPR
jgi:hypothetical protein